MKTLLAISVTAAMLAIPAHAQNLQITGFGQMVAGTVTDGTTFPDLGYDSDWDFKDESLFALQVRGELNDQWSATAQMVARGRDDFEPEFAWAYVAWDGGNGWSAKFGRQRVPFFKYSDFLEVGYAYPWLRPSGAVYNASFSNFDGASASYAFSSGDWFNSIGLVGGSNEEGPPINQKVDTLVGIYVDSTYGNWLSLRASYLQADVTVDIDDLVPLLDALSNNGFANVAAAIDYNKDPAQFFGVAAEVNRGNWLIGGEFTRTTIDNSSYGDRNQYYLAAAYRINAFTPNVTWGRRDNKAKTRTVDLLPNVPPLAGLRAAVTGVVLLEDFDATYWSYGLRWDVASNIALKADYTQYTNKTPISADADSFAVGLTFTF